MDQPVFEPWERIAAACGRPMEAAARGLWRAGTLEGLARPCVAIVGTRAATLGGKRLARELAVELGAAGCCVVSGLALGIDAAAHEGALDAGAPTVAVLGGGHACLFPRRNRDLAQRILIRGGAVVSPYAPDRPAAPWQFLARNGIVAALADAVVVVEAPARSGALNTAGWAAGRIPVLACPGDVDRFAVQGCLALIRDGATLARNSADVLEALGLSGMLFSRASEPPALTTQSSALLAALESGAAGLDDLAKAAGMEAPAAMAALTVLELEGVVECREGARYARTRPTQK